MCIRARLPRAPRDGPCGPSVLRPSRQKNEPFSCIRTVTVGSGIAPGSADPRHLACRGARGLVRKTAITAGGDLHPALRMLPPYARPGALAIPGHGMVTALWKSRRAAFPARGREAWRVGDRVPAWSRHRPGASRRRPCCRVTGCRKTALPAFGTSVAVVRPPTVIERRFPRVWSGQDIPASCGNVRERTAHRRGARTGRARPGRHPCCRAISGRRTALLPAHPGRPGASRAHRLRERRARAARRGGRSRAGPVRSGEKVFHMLLTTSRHSLLLCQQEKYQEALK